MYARDILISLVVLTTVYQTVFTAILMILGKGWGIARTSLTYHD